MSRLRATAALVVVPFAVGVTVLAGGTAHAATSQQVPCQHAMVTTAAGMVTPHGIQGTGGIQGSGSVSHKG